MHAVIFDFDGLILDTEWPQVRAWQELFKESGATLPDHIWMSSIGRGADQDQLHPAHELSQQLGKPVNIGEYEKRHRARYLELVEEEALLPGVIDRLNEARDLGWAVGLSSSSSRAWVEGYLNRFELRDRFQAISSSDDVEITKPDPAVYLRTLQILGAKPETTIALEDSPMGTLAAQRAGLYAVAVPNQLTSQTDLSHADLVAPSLKAFSLKDVASRR